MWPTPTGALLWLAAEQKPWKYTITQNNEAAFQTVQQRQKYEPSAGPMAAPAAAHCDRSRLKVSRFRSRDGDSCVISVFNRCRWSCVSLYGSQKQTNKQTTTTLVTFPEFHYYKIWPISFNNLDLTFILKNCSRLLYPLWLNIVHELYLSTNTEQGYKVVHSCFF